MKKNSARTTYTGTAYIGVVGPELEVGECRDSVLNIVRRPGDVLMPAVRATKGFEARQLHLDRWLEETRHEWCLFLDHDMVYPPDTLERLRAHGRPYVSGHYLRRRFAPIASVWFRPWTGKWPFEPWAGSPERGKLHAIGASGWGCLLLHREVALAVRGLLKGEADIIEDDMDVWPYDLAAILRAIQGLQTLTTESVSLSTLRPALREHAGVLARELRPLRGDRGNVGSDIRYPFYALQAGYQLYGDPDVQCGHMLNYPLHPDDLAGQGEDEHQRVAAKIKAGIKSERKKMQARLEALRV